MTPFKASITLKHFIFIISLNLLFNKHVRLNKMRYLTNYINERYSTKFRVEIRNITLRCN